MTDPSERFAPPRLRGEPELGALLRQANEQYGAGLDEAAAYGRIQEQLTSLPARSQKSVGAGRAGLFVGALALAGALVWLRASGGAGTSIVLGPEERVPSAAPLLAAPPARTLDETPSETAAVSETAAELPPEVRPQPKREPVQLEPRRQQLEEKERKQLPKEAPAKEPEPEQEKAEEDDEARVEAPAHAAARQGPRAPELDCMQMARDGAPRQAETCFTTLASGAGLRAEMALHELARLRRDVLGDASGALAALSEYRQRFPSGSLRHEVALSRVELLVRLGRARDALRESEELLTSPGGRIRAAELHVLRGNMYRTALSDLNAAAAEFARAERLGGALGAEATYLRGTCLEALGDGRAALEAYERYMSTPRRPRAVEVRRRIAALSLASPRSEQAP